MSNSKDRMSYVPSTPNCRVMPRRQKEIAQLTGEGQDERARASDQEHDADVQTQRDAAVEHEGRDADTLENVVERGPAFEDGHEEHVEDGADLGRREDRAR